MSGQLHNVPGPSQDAFDALNGNITTYRAWHYVNKIDNASGTVAMPSNCNEILLLFNISDTIQMTLVIPYIAFVASDRSFRTGYYSSSSYQASGVITGNTEGFRNLVLYLNGQTVSLSASNYCSIYYR